MWLDPDAASAAAQDGFEIVCESDYPLEERALIPAMGNVDIEFQEYVILREGVLSEEFEHGRWFTLPYNTSVTSCFELSENVEMHLRSNEDHGGVGLDVKPGRTAIRDIDELLPGWGGHTAYFRCADQICSKNLEDRASFSYTIYTLSSRPTIDYWVALQKARATELSQVLDIIADNINWWVERTDQGHPEYQSEIDDLLRQCDRALEVIAELDSMGTTVDPVWFEVCGE